MQRRRASLDELSFLGLFELLGYLGIAWWILSDRDSSGLLPLDEVLRLYFLVGLILIPSATIFLIPPKSRSKTLVKLAKKLQISIFVFVCIACIPAILYAQWHTQALVACLVGIVSFPVMLFMTGRYKKTMDQDDSC